MLMRLAMLYTGEGAAYCRLIQRGQTLHGGASLNMGSDLLQRSSPALLSSAVLAVLTLLSLDLGVWAGPPRRPLAEATLEGHAGLVVGGGMADEKEGSGLMCHSLIKYVMVSET
jgi:hypothetical protein